MRARLLGFTLAACLALGSPVAAQFTSVRVQVIDRGQADGILIRTPNSHWVVIDAGTNRQQAEAMESEWGVDRVALVITSHRHGDHYGGKAEILRRFPVDRYLGNLADCPDRMTDDTIRGVLEERKIPTQSPGADTIVVDGRLLHHSGAGSDGGRMPGRGERQLSGRADGVWRVPGVRVRGWQAASDLSPVCVGRVVPVCAVGRWFKGACCVTTGGIELAGEVAVAAADEVEDPEGVGRAFGVLLVDGVPASAMRAADLAAGVDRFRHVWRIVLRRDSTGHRMPYRIVQPSGPDKGRQTTVVSEHATVAEAFAALDRLAEEAHRTGGRIETIELIVVDAEGQVMSRMGVH